MQCSISHLRMREATVEPLVLLTPNVLSGISMLSVLGDQQRGGRENSGLRCDTTMPLRVAAEIGGGSGRRGALSQRGGVVVDGDRFPANTLTEGGSVPEALLCLIFGVSVRLRSLPGERKATTDRGRCAGSNLGQDRQCALCTSVVRLVRIYPSKGVSEDRNW